MNKRKKTSKAFDILHRRYIGENAERQASLEVERVNAEVARTIYDLRKKAGLTQKELAQMVGTTQSVISRLEDADYEGHSLSMLSRIAHALKRRIIIQIDNPIEKDEPLYELVELTKSFRPSFSSKHYNLNGLRPGQIAPRSGQYQQVGPRGGRGKEVTVAKGDPLPPTPRSGMTYNLKNSVKDKTNVHRVAGSAFVETTKNKFKKGKIIK